jgi:hypothetical protein
VHDGLRLTHDVKNSAVDLHAHVGKPSGRTTAMGAAQRQLPDSGRLRGTLEQLRTPEVAAREPPVPASQWWSDLRSWLEGSGIALEGASTPTVKFPRPLRQLRRERAWTTRAKVARELRHRTRCADARRTRRGLP